RLSQDGRPILRPGDPAASELVRRISSLDPEEMMPPPKSNLALSKEEIDTVRRWVQEGAEWKKHWAFLPLQALPVPSLRSLSRRVGARSGAIARRDSANPARWPRNELDWFILAQLQTQGLQPAPEASRERWLRRVTFDLTGLPPTLAEVDDFVSDFSADAYERVVERLLGSPAYGERMATE